MRRTRVYIAGPLSTGNLVENIKPAVDAAQYLIERGYAPFCPHLSHFWEVLAGKSTPWEEWLEVDMAWLETADALLRLPGYSRGADREIKFAQSHNVCVYYSMEELLIHETSKVAA
jgi:hypothetical protein